VGVGVVADAADAVDATKPLSTANFSRGNQLWQPEVSGHAPLSRKLG
jgi:hypothetical protein